MSGEIEFETIESGHRLGPYEILEEIGRGGMGVVYKAHEAALNRTVALKVLPDHLASNPGFVQRFNREAQSAAALHHPGIVTVYSVGAEDKIHYIAMELVNGATLADVLEVGGPLDVSRALEITAEICDALAEAHEKNIIHRDIKPHNIMLDDKNRVKMTDFGLARAVNDQTLTTAGFVLGTPTHMAPEQCNGQPADQRSDLYSVGVVLYEMLAGKPPYSGETPLSLMRQIADMPFPDVRETLPDISDDVVRILQRFVAKNPDERYQSGTDAAKDLREAINAKPVASKTTVGMAATAPAMTDKSAEQDSTVIVEKHPAYQKAKRGMRRGMIAGAVIALLFVLALWGSLRVRRALVNSDASAPIEWESPEIPAYTSPFDESQPEVQAEPAAVAEEPVESVDTTTPADGLPPELQDRVRTGSDPESVATTTSEPAPEPTSTNTSSEPTYTPPVEDSQNAIEKFNSVLKQVDDALGGSSNSGKPGKGKGKRK